MNPDDIIDAIELAHHIARASGPLVQRPPNATRTRPSSEAKDGFVRGEGNSSTDSSVALRSRLIGLPTGRLSRKWPKAAQLALRTAKMTNDHDIASPCTKRRKRLSRHATRPNTAPRHPNSKTWHRPPDPE